ncbi:MAG: helix-turn-helix domain-containing protein [Nocardioides sp.]
MADVNGPARRRYRSSLRAGLAEQTRSAVVQAALAEFLARGYAGATVDRIAERAGVSRPTVFAVGPKATLMKLARDRAIAGDDDPHAITERPNFALIAEAPDAESALRAYAAISAEILGRFADLNEVLRQGAAIDPALADLWQVSEQERLVGATGVVRTLTRQGRLRDGLSMGDAVDVLWVLTAPEQYHRMTRDRGWTHEQWAGWYADSVVRLLLG